MRILYLSFALALMVVAGGCSHNDSTSQSTSGMASPRVAATSSGARYSGWLDVFPCRSGSSIYVGNYFGIPPVLSAINATYSILDGAAQSGVGRPVLLPLGTYDMIYWGYTLPSDTVITSPAITEPSIVLNGDLANQNYGLRPWQAGDTLYRPVFDYVFAMKEVAVGSDSMAVDLRRAVAEVSVMLRPADSSAFSDRIDSISVMVGSVARELNLYTAEAADQTATVLIPLRFGAGRVNAYNTVAVFPSAAAPQFTISMTLTTGEVRTYTTRLTQPLTAGTMLLLSVNIGTIFATPSSTGDGFSVSNWRETTQTINTGPIY